MYQPYVPTICANHMYQPYVPTICTNHMYQPYVPTICTNHMYQPYVPTASILKISTFFYVFCLSSLFGSQNKQRFLSLTLLTNSSFWCTGTVFAVSISHGSMWHIDPISLNLGIRCWERLVSSFAFFTTRNVVPGTDWITGYVDTKACVDILGKRKISRICRESNTIQWSPENILISIQTELLVCNIIYENNQQDVTV